MQRISIIHFIQGSMYSLILNGLLFSQDIRWNISEKDYVKIYTNNDGKNISIYLGCFEFLDSIFQHFHVDVWPSMSKNIVLAYVRFIEEHKKKGYPFFMV
ncbi:hypothetical protein KP509_1Z227200 [Ceratopteris richardii]|nr:hypothetical protein KP509_1Z227200 [Ceratopteris richardii]